MSTEFQYPRIKVCGVTRIVDLDLLAGCGVDAVGFNFVSKSRRAVELVQADELCARAAQLGLARVAVVMDLTDSELDTLLQQIDVDFVQLHGSERPSLESSCRGLPIIKATSWTGRAEELQLIEAWGSAAAQVDSQSKGSVKTTSELRAWLIDAYAPVQGGGTGRLARWDLLQPRPPQLTSRPIILAGGLTPANVADAIASTAANGVDTASGVESRPGIKSPELVRSFATLAIAAFAKRAAEDRR